MTYDRGSCSRSERARRRVLASLSASILSRLVELNADFREAWARLSCDARTRDPALSTLAKVHSRANAGRTKQARFLPAA